MALNKLFDLAKQNAKTKDTSGYSSPNISKSSYLEDAANEKDKSSSGVSSRKANALKAVEKAQADGMKRTAQEKTKQAISTINHDQQSGYKRTLYTKLGVNSDEEYANKVLTELADEKDKSNESSKTRQKLEAETLLNKQRFGDSLNLGTLTAEEEKRLSEISKPVVGDVLVGTGQRIASGYTNTVGTAAATSEAYEDKKKKEGYTSKSDAEVFNPPAGKDYTWSSEKLYNVADDLSQKSEERIARAKSNTGKVGGFAIDVASTGLEMASDALVGAALGGVGGLPAMAVRVFGQGAQEARLNGGDLSQQIGYGLASAAVEVVSEQFAGLAGGKIYGKGFSDDFVKNLASKITSNRALQTAIITAANTASEGFEELFSSVMSPVTQTIYNGEKLSLGYWWESMDWSEAAYEALCGAFLGGLGAGATVHSTYIETAWTNVGAELKASKNNAAIGEISKGLLLDKDSEGYAIAENLNKQYEKGGLDKLSTSSLGRLYMINAVETSALQNAVATDPNAQSEASYNASQKVTDQLNQYRAVSAAAVNELRTTVAQAQANAVTAQEKQDVAESVNPGRTVVSDYTSEYTSLGMSLKAAEKKSAALTSLLSGNTIDQNMINVLALTGNNTRAIVEKVTGVAFEGKTTTENLRNWLSEAQNTYLLNAKAAEIQAEENAFEPLAQSIVGEQSEQNTEDVVTPAEGNLTMNGASLDYETFARGVRTIAPDATDNEVAEIWNAAKADNEIGLDATDRFSLSEAQIEAKKSAFQMSKEAEDLKRTELNRGVDAINRALKEAGIDLTVGVSNDYTKFAKGEEGLWSANEKYAINPNTRTILFNSDIVDSAYVMTQILSHEVFHDATYQLGSVLGEEFVADTISSFRNMVDAGKVKDPVISRMCSDDYKSYMLDSYRKHAVAEWEAKNGRKANAQETDSTVSKITDTYVNEEIAANLLREALAVKDVTILDILAQENPFVTQRAEGVLDKLINKFKKKPGMDEYTAMLEDVSTRLTDAMKSAGHKVNAYTDKTAAEAAESGSTLGASDKSGKKASYGLFNEKNYKMESNTADKSKLALDEDGNPVFLSGREVLTNLLKANSVYSEEAVDSIIAYFDKAAKFMKDKGVEYQYINLNEVNDATLDVRKDSKGNVKQVIFSARVKNGEYAVNFDLTQICKRREAFGKYVDKLFADYGFNMLSLSSSNMLEMSKVLSEEGYDTACLGCFVEAKRHYMEDFANKFCKKWNDAVKRINKNATYFEFADTDTAKLNVLEVDKVNEILKGYKAFNAESEAENLKAQNELTKRLRESGLTEEDMKAIRENAGDKNLSADKRISNKMLKEMEADPKNVTETWINQLLKKKVLSGGLKASNAQKVGNLIRSSDKYQHLLRPSDIMTSNGLHNLGVFSSEMVSLLQGSYGSGAPKLARGFVPYNNEIAYLNLSGKKYKTLEDYLTSIAGVRAQSFSDFKIENVFDMLQFLADLTARDLPAHLYTKEIACAKILGLAGIKVNMSVMFNVNGESYWGDEETAKKYAGLRKADANSMTADWHYWQGPGVSEEKAKALAEKYKGVTYNFADKYAQEEAMNRGEGKPYVQSIDVKEAMDLQNDKAYSKNVGIIGVGYSDFHIRMMLDDWHFKYVIPYHRSSLPTDVYEGANLNYAFDGTSTQNTLEITKIKNSAGEDVTSSVDLRSYETLEEFLKDMRDRGYKIETSKFEGGHGKFKLYEDLAKTADPKQTAVNYVEDCFSKGHLPLFYQFYDNSNYYKLLYDFSVYDSEGNYAPQGPVKLFNEKGEIIGMPEGAFDANGLVNEYMNVENERNRELWSEEKVERVEDRLYDIVKRSSIRDAEYLELAKDPEANRERLQKMVGDAAREAGYDSPVLYHGSRIKFTKFKEGGIFTSTDEWTAGQYGKNHMGLLGKTDNMLGIDANGDSWAMIFLDESLQEDVEKTLGEDYAEWINEELEFYQNDNKFVTSNYLLDYAEQKGYRGVIIKNVDEEGKLANDYVYLDSSDVKSADPVTYDDAGNIIPLSERFNEKNEDIRYSFGTGIRGLDTSDTLKSEGVDANEERLAEAGTYAGRVPDIVSTSERGDTGESGVGQDASLSPRGNIGRSSDDYQKALLGIIDDLPELATMLRGSKNKKTQREIREQISLLPKEDQIEVRAAEMRVKYANKVATMQEDRFDRLLSDFSYGKNAPRATKAYITLISPADFISLTTTDAEAFRERNTNGLNEGKTEDRDNVIQNSGPLYLAVDEAGEVIGHEGRHRMRGLELDGYDRVAVVIKTPYTENAAPIKTLRLTGQDFGERRSYGSAYVHHLLPASYEYRDICRSIFSPDSNKNPVTKEENIRYSIPDNFEASFAQWIRENSNDPNLTDEQVARQTKAIMRGIKAGTAVDNAKLQRKIDRTERKLQEQKESAKAKELATDLGWKMYTGGEVAKAKRLGKEAVAAERQKRIEALDWAQFEKEQAVAAQRERDNARMEKALKNAQEDKTRAVDRAAAKERFIGASNTQAMEIYQKRKAAERLHIKEDSYKGRIAGIKDNMKLNRKLAKNVLKNSKAVEKKRYAIETEQGEVNTLRKIPGETKRLEELQEKAKNLRVVGRDAYRAFVNAAQAIDEISKRQVGGVRAGTLVNIAGASSSTVETMFKDGLVDRSGNRIGDSLKDVLLCIDKKGKVDHGKQAVLQDYMLHLHNIDRMSIEQRALDKVVAFEESNPWLAEMNPKELAKLVAMTEAELRNTGKQQAHDIAVQYYKLLNTYRNAKNKPVFGDSNGNPVTAETSREKVAQYEKDAAWVVEKAQGVYDWYDKFMQEWAVGDSITQEQYDAMKEMYPHYAPTYRQDMQGVGAANFVGMNGASIDKAVKAAKGSTLDIVNIEDSYANLVSKIVKLNRNNELYRNLVDTAMMDEDGLFSDMMVFDWESGGDFAKMAESFYDADIRATETDEESLVKTANGYKLTAWIEGEKVSAYISEDLFKSISEVTGKSEEKFKTLVKVGNTLTGPMKTAITGINPTFALRNISRDLPTAVVNSISGLAFPKYYAQAAAEIAKNSDNWKTFKALGGTNAGYYNTQKGFANSFERGITKESILEKAGAFNEVTESQTRFAEYLATIDRLGDTYENRLQGIKNSAEVTVDFSRKGSYGKLINAWVPYWNPAVQGIDKVVRSVIESPEGSNAFLHGAKTIGRAAMTTVLFEAVLYAALKAAGRYDDWDELNDRTKDTYYCIPIGENKFLKIPKNREWGAVLGTPVMRLLEYANGRDNPFENYIQTSIEPNFLPGAILRFTENGIESDVIGVSQAIDLARNKDFANRTIVPSYLQSGTVSQQYESDTSWLSKQLGEMFNFSPIQADYIIKDYFGDFGDIYVKMFPVKKEADNTFIGGVENVWETVSSPFVADNRYSNQGTSTYYEMLDNLDKVVQDRKNQMPDDEYKNTKEYQTQQAIKTLYGKKITELNKQARELPDGEEKDAIKTQINLLTKNALEFYDQSMSGAISNPELTATYAQYPESVSDELIRLNGLAESYNIKPSTYKPTSYTDPYDSDYEYKLDKEQQDKYREIYDRIYSELALEEMNRSYYKKGSDTDKAEYLEEVRDETAEQAKEEFLEWLDKNYTSTAKN